MIRRRQKWVAGLAIVMLVLTASVANAQPQGQRGRGGQGGPGGGGRMPMFGGGGAMGNVMLLMREDVRKHLELLDEQVEDLQALSQEMFQGMRNRSPEEREGAMQDLEKKINEILLPHQVKRINQIAVQQRMRGGRGLLSDDMVEKLAITEAQREKLTAKQQEVQEELAKKVAELRKQYEEKLVSELTPAQRAKLKEMVGEPFELSQEPGRGGFGGGGFGGAPRGGGEQPQGGPGGGRRRG